MVGPFGGSDGYSVRATLHPCVGCAGTRGTCGTINAQFSEKNEQLILARGMLIRAPTLTTCAEKLSHVLASICQ